MIDNEIILFALVKDLISKSLKNAVSNILYFYFTFFLFGMSSSSPVCRSVLIQK